MTSLECCQFAASFICKTALLVTIMLDYTCFVIVIIIIVISILHLFPVNSFVMNIFLPFSWRKPVIFLKITLFFRNMNMFTDKQYFTEYTLIDKYVFYDISLLYGSFVLVKYCLWENTFRITEKQYNLKENHRFSLKTSKY